MSGSRDIFAKQRLTIGQLRAVADRRFGDAVALVETGDNARANGAQYLAGIVIEILLKGQLLKRYPSAASKMVDDLSPDESEVWKLIWRSHDLGDILDRLPLLRASLAERSRRAGTPYLRWLTGICERWTIHARYSPHTSTMSDAKEMLKRVRTLKELIK
jgi:hypothetical protein